MAGFHVRLPAVPGSTLNAQKDLRATALVDVATLTGGVVVALGHFCAGFFANTF